MKGEKLGRPANGTRRKITTSEAIVVGVTDYRAYEVEARTDGVVVWKVSVKGGDRILFGPGSFTVGELERFWAKSGRAKLHQPSSGIRRQPSME